MSENPSFQEVLGQVREVTLGAYAHKNLSFEQLVEALQPDRNLSHQPLFQVIFALQNAPMLGLELPDLTLSSLEIESGTAKFDLTLSMEDTEQGLVGFLEYNTDLFHATTISRMLGHLMLRVKSYKFCKPLPCIVTSPVSSPALGVSSSAISASF